MNSFHFLNLCPRASLVTLSHYFSSVCYLITHITSYGGREGRKDPLHKWSIPSLFNIFNKDGEQISLLGSVWRPWRPRAACDLSLPDHSPNTTMCNQLNKAFPHLLAADLASELAPHHGSHHAVFPFIQSQFDVLPRDVVSAWQYTPGDSANTDTAGRRYRSYSKGLEGG